MSLFIIQSNYTQPDHINSPNSSKDSHSNSLWFHVFRVAYIEVVGVTVT